MKNRLLIATATVALLAGTSLAPAQDKKEGAAPAPAAQQNAPAEKIAPPAPAPQNAPAARPDVKVDSKGSAQAPTSATERKVEGKTDTKADVKASDNKMNAKPDAKGDAKAEAKPEGKAQNSTQNSAETKSPAAAKDSANDASKNPATPATTTGQGAAGSTGARANLTTEQKTTIKTVIREQKVAPVTNVNFTISVGTRIPREVRYYPLPPRVISVYPQWRGYEYILVRDEILVIDPRTREIVAVIEA